MEGGLRRAQEEYEEVELEVANISYVIRCLQSERDQAVLRSFKAKEEATQVSSRLPLTILKQKPSKHHMNRHRREKHFRINRWRNCRSTDVRSFFRILGKAFVLTFLGEWGDRSQAATVLLAAKWSFLIVCVDDFRQLKWIERWLCLQRERVGCASRRHCWPRCGHCRRRSRWNDGRSLDFGTRRWVCHFGTRTEGKIWMITYWMSTKKCLERFAVLSVDYISHNRKKIDKFWFSSSIIRLHFQCVLLVIGDIFAFTINRSV